MVDINDAVKPESKNVHITVTFQLSKSSSRQRFYTQDNIGMAKNMIDPASTAIMIRDLYDDEITGEKNALSVFRLEGKNGKSKIPVTLHSDKRYQIIFIVKNREGMANQYQIVVEHDMSRNILREVGITHVMMDF
jgi:replicative DNA helicase